MKTTVLKGFLCLMMLITASQMAVAGDTPISRDGDTPISRDGDTPISIYNEQDNLSYFEYIVNSLSIFRF